MSQYKVSVVIPTYNSGDYLVDLINSIKEQTLGFENIEVLIIDDNSTDSKTLDLIKNYQNTLDNCQAVFFDENHDFPGTSRNKGIEIATGETVILADHDDTYTKDAFERLYNELKNNNADFVFSNYYRVYPDKKVTTNHFNGETIIIEDISQNLDLFDLPPSIWTKLFKKEFLVKNNIKFIERMLSEDLYVFIFALLVSSKTVYLDGFYSYNYNIRDSASNKSTIHLRNKKILDGVINGYFKTDELLSTLNKEEYFSKIFQKHFVFWITSLIDSSLDDNDKIDLLKKINPLFVKYLKINNDFSEKIYNPLVEPILNEDYKKIINLLKYLKIRRKLSKKLK